MKGDVDESMITVLSKSQLSERWGVDVSTLNDYERDGYIRRLNLPGAKYSLIAIEIIENEGLDNLILRKNREIQDLTEENRKLRDTQEALRKLLG